MDQLLQNVDKNRASGLILIHYRKAFDMVDHELLLLKLKTYGIDEASNKWFESYLLRRQQFVSYFGKVSNYQDVSHGVPQGSILGPLFFIIYINDLPLHIQTTDVEIDLYADDTILMSSADIDAIGCDLRSKLNQVWLEVENWANANKMPLNESKTKSLLVTGKRLPGKIDLQDKQLALVTSNGCMLEQVETVKLLGLELDSEMTFTCHVDKLCKKLSQRIGVLNRIKCCLPFKQIILYYNSLVKSVMNYLNVVWHTCSKEILLKVLR